MEVALKLCPSSSRCACLRAPLLLPPVEEEHKSSTLAHTCAPWHSPHPPSVEETAQLCSRSATEPGLPALCALPPLPHRRRLLWSFPTQNTELCLQPSTLLLGVDPKVRGTHPSMICCLRLPSPSLTPSTIMKVWLPLSSQNLELQLTGSAGLTGNLVGHCTDRGPWPVLVSMYPIIGQTSTTQ